MISINKTRQLNLCVSCEICNAVCPVGAIKIEYKGGQFLPRVDEEKCKGCGLCVKLCPGISIASLNLRKVARFEEFAGGCLKVYSAYSKDQNIRKNSTSGGLITQLIVKLLDDGKFEGAFVLPFNTFTGSPARLELVTEVKKVMAASKSKYIPASVYNVIKTLETESDPEYIIVGTPCQIRGIKNYIKENNVNDENLLFLGLFCDATLNFNIIRYFEDKYSKGNEKIIKFDFRNKEKDGWPGHPKLYFDSNREVMAHRSERIKVKKYFQLERCLYCLDKLNRSADISFGDCYIRWRELPESSTVMVRTEKGKRIFDEYSHLFNLVGLNIETIIKSQGISDKRENLEFAKALIKDGDFSLGGDSEKIDRKIGKSLAKRRKYIDWGRKYKINRINLSTILSDIIDRWEIAKVIIKAGKTLGVSLLSDTITDRNTKESRSGGNVIIVGGELSENLGAQAMTFTVVDQVKRRFPNKKIYLFSTNAFERDEREKELYNFEIMPWGIGTKLNLLSSSQRIEREYISGEWITHPKYQGELREIIENADFFIDVSGYRLFSHKIDSNFPLSFGSYDYLLNIINAKKFSIPFYIFPQSIGPFDYPLKDKVFLYPLMWKYLRYPEKIFPREEEGVEHLRKFTQKNVERQRDIVLLNDGYNIDNIFKEKIELKGIDILPDSVGIIPNKKVMRRTDPREIYSIYDSIIRKLIRSGKKICLVGYAQEDLSICQNIKALFPNEDAVKLISNDFNALEIEGIIAQFDFIVTSRYHSIVNAYKNGVPALTIGWSTKYFELLKDFNQLDYFFDARKGLESSKLLKSLDGLTKNYAREGKNIKCKLYDMEKNEAFKVLE